MHEYEYDYIIVGAGPAGLTLAWYLAKYNKKILLVEREASIGGCHRVRRVDGLFTEHGPRIYLDNYFSFIDILSQMNINFYDLFTDYDFSVNLSGYKLISILSFSELIVFAYEYIKFIFDKNPSRYITMDEFTKKYDFDPASVEYIDEICRLSDGGTIKNYTLFEFFQIFNQNTFYNIYQPRLPNDVGLFKYWQNALVQTKNVDIMLNTEILSINTQQHVASLTASTNNEIIELTATNYIFALPPKPMLNVIKKSSNQNMFGNINDLTVWATASKYLVYIPIIFHWNTKVRLKKIQGMTGSEYDVVYVVMSDYMNFDDPRSQTVITCAVKAADRKSSYNNLTADECTRKELIREVFRQLKQHQPYLPEPTYSLLSPEMYKYNGKWESTDSAYFYTKAGYWPNKSVYNNLFWVGSHNGNSNYNFTSMESAMENAIALLHEIEPQSRNSVRTYQAFTVDDLILIIFVLFVLLSVVKSNN